MAIETASGTARDKEDKSYVKSLTRPNQTAQEVVVGNGSFLTSGLIVDCVSPTMLYLGEGLFGAETSDPKWKIKKIDFSSGVVIKAASDNFDQVWDNRASLTYV